jgi:DNA polymerase III delta prime subunit
MAREYSELSSYDFECLVRDLLQAWWNQRLEIFTAGKDGGVDLRLFKPDQATVYVQCKHSPHKTYSDIRSSLKKEAKKAAESLVGEYWLVTSATLTANNKEEICDDFGRDLLSPERILWQGDIDNLLQQYPHVEQANYKLYMTSAATIQRILHSETFYRNETLLKRIRSRIKLFVQTPAFEQARAILNEMNTCLITGEPGIGKTTLAEMLIFSLIDEGYECVVIDEDIAEAERMFRAGSKQVFYYDDFLGQTSLAEKMNKNEDGRLLKLVRHLENEPHHKLILTTREYLYRQALRTYGRLSDRTIQLRKYILDLASYNKFHRAHILYNHIYHSTLPSEATVSLLQDKKYYRVINHPNYNPRLIEFIVSLADPWPESSDTAFADYMIASLDDPSELWRHAYEDQLTPVARDLLLVLASLGTGELLQVHKALQAYHLALHGDREQALNIKKALEEVDGIFVQTNNKRGGARILVQLINPSFRDYINRYVRDNPYVLEHLVEGAVYAEQLQAIFAWGWQDDKHTSQIRPIDRLTQTSIDALLPRLIKRLADLIDVAPPLKPTFFDLPFDLPEEKATATRRLILLFRLCKLARFELQGPEVDLIVSHTLNAWNNTKFSESGWKGSAIVAVELLRDLGQENNNARLLREALASLFCKQLKEPDDFDYLDTYWKIVEPGMNRHAEVRRLFVDFVPAYVDELLTGDPEDIGSKIDDLWGIAEDFGVDVSEEVGELQAVVDDYKERERREEGPSAPSRTLRDFLGIDSEVSRDQQVDHLFDTLRTD